MRRIVGKLIVAGVLFAAVLSVPRAAYAYGSCSDAYDACTYEAQGAFQIYYCGNEGGPIICEYYCSPWYQDSCQSY